MATEWEWNIGSQVAEEAAKSTAFVQSKGASKSGVAEVRAALI